MASQPASSTQLATFEVDAPPPELAGPRALPTRQVTSATIEDAYVQFIIYCNPALPNNADIASLREGFRTPPKSAGKAFDPFVIFELVRQFYTKEIKTWAELTVRLGVEPPDLTKDESSQKVAQYGVRLKKWMNSMHVKAFFEYLMNIPNEYWTQIPKGPDPLGEPFREGVALEDDMALRALIPQIRPKRGRKRPDEDDQPFTPVQRPRLSPAVGVDDRSGAAQSWPAAGEYPHLQPHSDTPRSAVNPWPSSADPSQRPFGQWPQSAITPTTRGPFWEDPNEPRSAITPSKMKPGQRRGTKNVSSAWKTGPSESGKTRGRPPINRTPVDAQSFSTASWPSQHQSIPNPTAQPAGAPNHHVSDRVPATSSTQYTPTMGGLGTAAPNLGGVQQDGSRPARPSISLQVPQRPPSSVRLASPPVPPPQAQSSQVPPVHVNGVDTRQETPSTDTQSKNPGWHTWASEAMGAYAEAPSTRSHDSSASGGASQGMPDYYFEKIEDRTNVDAIMSYFVQAAFDADWLNADGTPGERATLEEATAIVNVALQTMYKSATSPQVFLINLAALAGARHLMTRRARYVRRGGDENFRNYSFEWEYRFGHVHGKFTMLHKVPRSMWPLEDPPPVEPPGEGEEGDPAEQAKKENMSAADWKKKYENLLSEVERRNKEMWELRTKVMGWGRGG
ncbi:ARS binding protein 2 domain-containing protein [Sarocladium implicatum]|nr:ARS binding protein 2 domain-containing protein [Sarocladium implicatum]